MDSTFVVIDDTLRTIILEAWWKNPAWFTALAAVFSIFITLIVFRYTRRLHDRAIKIEINARWVELTRSRLVFWEALEDSYEVWKQEIANGTKLPMDDLIWKAGIPLDIGTIDEPMAYKERLSKELKDQDSPKRWILQFSKRIFSSHGPNKSILPAKPEPGYRHSFYEFYQACAGLSHALNGWSETIPLKYLIMRFRGDFVLIIMLVWLELSLIERLGKRWADRGHLFKLALKISNN